MAKTYFRIQSDFIEHRLPARNVGRASVSNETMEMPPIRSGKVGFGLSFSGNQPFLPA